MKFCAPTVIADWMKPGAARSVGAAVASTGTGGSGASVGAAVGAAVGGEVGTIGGGGGI